MTPLKKNSSYATDYCFSNNNTPRTLQTYLIRANNNILHSHLHEAKIVIPSSLPIETKVLHTKFINQELKTQKFLFYSQTQKVKQTPFTRFPKLKLAKCLTSNIENTYPYCHQQPIIVSSLRLHQVTSIVPSSSFDLGENFTVEGGGG